MIGSLSRLAQPFIQALTPEQAHEVALRALELGLYPRPTGPDAPELKTKVWGLSFPNPIAVAAGFDKDARVAHALLGLGCGFAEVGTITPLPQSGNPRPRVFRLRDDHAVINRLGFNNGGHTAALSKLKRGLAGGIVGVNIGANKNSQDRTDDYVQGLHTFYDVSAYFTVNISSPNTPGLRDLQAPAALDELLGRLMAAREKQVANGKSRTPIIVKIAPDIAEDDIPLIVARLVDNAVDGIAVSNTTLSRVGLKSEFAKEAGGLSGQPLFERSTILLARVFAETGGRIPLVGIGGVDSGSRALEKIEAGATLVQFYTGLIYEGVELITKIKDELAIRCRENGVASCQDLVGTRSSDWAARRF